MDTFSKNVDENDVQDPMKRMPKTKFSAQILKSVIGETRANQVLTSISMNILPKLSGSMGGGIKEGKCSPLAVIGRFIICRLIFCLF